HDGRVVFSGAHEDVLLYRASTGAIEQIRTPGVWLGARRGIRSVMLDTTLRLDEGDVMLLYTDGVTEERNRDGTLFDLERVLEAFRESETRSIDEIRDHILNRARAWMHVQHDDMSIV